MNTDIPLSGRIKTVAGVYDADAVSRMDELTGGCFRKLPADAYALLKNMAGCSSYLYRLVVASPQTVQECFDNPPESVMSAVLEEVGQTSGKETRAEQMRALRILKKKAALVTAMADLAGVWSVMQTACYLSRFADAAVGAALVAAAREQGLGGTSGMTVLAMGKLGAFELNYSSDIDLVVLYDRAHMECRDPAQAATLAVRTARTVVSILQEQTADGYVFRTDLRLRPDPGVSALAVSVEAAERYYEAHGQNWERMAFIKARPCAGDSATGYGFLERLRPYIWRRYLDFAAIEDIHAVRRHIHAVKGGEAIEFAGHDIKLGRGGIREIEFYVQTRQLIHGGRDTSLRTNATLQALQALCRAGHVGTDAAEDLSRAYCYFRHVEHRLQMLDDEQTHRIPSAPERLDRLRVFAGEPDMEVFRQKTLGHLHDVEKYYAGLFEADGLFPGQQGTLVFTGIEDHPGTLETLEHMGFLRGREISESIREWQRGRLRATRTERARKLLTRLVPPLLESLSNASDPDDAFFAFENFIAALPSGVQVFSLLLNNCSIFATLIRIITVSPHLARQISRQNNFIEQLLDNNWCAVSGEPERYDRLVCKVAGQAGNYEDILNNVRRVAGEQRFQISAQLAVDLIGTRDAAFHFTAIARACIRTLYEAARVEMASQHGDIEGALVIMALGALGTGDMSAQSDIDLMFLYDGPADAVSDGDAPLEAREYYARLVRRIVTALSAATQEGTLYDVDMQLRPSGRIGPSAVRFSAFRRYYRKEAWTWELMTLVRAGVVCGDPALSAAVEKEVETILCQRYSRDKLVRDIRVMRKKMHEAKPHATIWDVKNVLGGLTDIAFIIQFLTLVSAHRIGVSPRESHAALGRFGKAAFLSPDEVRTLVQAYTLFGSVLQMSRAVTDGVFDPDMSGRALKKKMADTCGASSPGEARAILAEHQGRVEKLFHSVIA